MISKMLGIVLYIKLNVWFFQKIQIQFLMEKNVAHPDGGLSFDCLLNCLDGVENSEGILIVATTNNI